MKSIILYALLIISFTLQAQNDSSTYEVVIHKGLHEPYKAKFWKDTIDCCSYFEIPELITNDSIFQKDFDAFFIKRNQIEAKLLIPNTDSISYYFDYQFKTNITYQSNELLSIKSQLGGDGRGCTGGTGFSEELLIYAYYIPQHKLLTVKDVFKQQKLVLYDKYLRAIRTTMREQEDEEFYDFMLGSKISQVFCNSDFMDDKPVLITEKGIAVIHGYSVWSHYFETLIFVELEQYKNEFQPWILEALEIK